MSRPPFGAFALALLAPVALLGLTACGSDDQTTAATEPTTTPAATNADDAALLGPFCAKHAAAEAEAAVLFADVPEEDADRSNVSEAEKPLVEAERKMLEHLRPYFASIELVPSEVRLDAAMFALSFVTRVESDLTIQPTDAQNAAEERLFAFVDENCT